MTISTAIATRLSTPRLETAQMLALVNDLALETQTGVAFVRRGKIESSVISTAGRNLLTVCGVNGLVRFLAALEMTRSTVL